MPVQFGSCERCGSPEIKRVRSRTLLKRAYGSLTGQRRYSCAACLHRGWTRARAAQPLGADEPSTLAAPGRPLEARDLRAAREERLRTLGLVLSAVLVGGILAGIVTQLLW